MSAPEQDARRARPESVAAVVVTGGSEGIGLAIARRLAAGAGAAPIVLIGRNGDRLASAVAAIRAAAPAARAIPLAADLCDPASLATLDACLAAERAHVEVLVNAAGMGLSGDFSELAPAEIERLLALNITALTRLMRHVLPAMRARRSGRIINIASLGGYVPGPYQAAYYASKAYVISLSEAVAAEVGGDGVRVLVVSPGPVSTRFHAKMDAERSLYRWLIPPMSPESVARWTALAVHMHLRGLVPGIFNTLLIVALRFLPHRLVIPVVGWLLNPRRERRNV